jgi:hypothetical protein
MNSIFFMLFIGIKLKQHETSKSNINIGNNSAK